MTTLLTFEDLQKATGYDRKGDVERCMIKNRIPFFYGKASIIFTTSDALNSALGLENGKLPPEPIKLFFD